MKKLLITGYKGFIGSHLYNHLKDSFDVDGIDFPDDIGDFKTDKIYDIVIHLAAFAALRDSIENPDKLSGRTNVVKSQPILIIVEI